MVQEGYIEFYPIKRDTHFAVRFAVSGIDLTNVEFASSLFDVSNNTRSKVADMQITKTSNGAVYDGFMMELDRTITRTLVANKKYYGDVLAISDGKPIALFNYVLPVIEGYTNVD